VTTAYVYWSKRGSCLLVCHVDSFDFILRVERMTDWRANAVRML